jgi:hypothetical protein
MNKLDSFNHYSDSWQYQSFSPDGSVDEEADIGRCFSCHANAERDDYVNTLDDMKSYDLEELTGSNHSSTGSQITGFMGETGS